MRVIHGRRRHHGNDIITSAATPICRAVERAGSVVSIMGSSSSEGEAREVVSILGNTRVTGPVGHSAVAVLGNTYVDSAVDGDVVAVFGERRARAQRGRRRQRRRRRRHGSSAIRARSFAAACKLSGAGPPDLVGCDRGSIIACFTDDRSLWCRASSGRGAWRLPFWRCTRASRFSFGEGITRCVRTLETQPGMSVLAAMLTALLVPGLLTIAMHHAHRDSRRAVRGCRASSVRDYSVRP